MPPMWSCAPTVRSCCAVSTLSLMRTATNIGPGVQSRQCVGAGTPPRPHGATALTKWQSPVHPERVPLQHTPSLRADLRHSSSGLDQGQVGDLLEILDAHAPLGVSRAQWRGDGHVDLDDLREKAPPGLRGSHCWRLEEGARY